MASKKPWRIIPRPLLETILNNHAQRHRVHQPLVLHGPRGVGKTTLILERLLNNWNQGPHITGYVDFAESIKAQTSPWASWSNSPPPSLSDCRKNLDQCLEAMAEKALRLGAITSRQIFTSLNKWHGLTTALKRVLNDSGSRKGSPAALWDRAVFVMGKECSGDEIDRVLGFGDKEKSVLSVEEGLYFKESVIALKLAKKVIEIQQGFRVNAIVNMNRTGGFSRSLTHSSTDWPVLLLDLLSQAAEIDHFQPKLVINNIEVLKHATIDDEFSVSGPLYHDSLIWRIIALGANERSLPIILVTSDRPLGGLQKKLKCTWSPTILVIQNTTAAGASTFEDIVDAYLAYLQISVVNPALDRALEILQKFAIDVHNGKVPDDGLRFGAPWRNPPHVDDPKLCMDWAKLQLMDFVQSLVNADFGVNYRIDYSEEIFDDPSAVALLQSLAGGAALCSTGSTLLSSHIYRNSEVSSKMACSAADAAHIPPLDSISVAQNNTGALLSPFDGTSRQ
ncbi:hypothetical protein TSUD_147620 [Trifolium subterraneum]|uniref:Uncharacterized protein n=1 Tax=Trifolium subterraneum TaxID=3900 RepID=A0A2Z6N0T6_TRISU|nr:hypothetical protein TSUD_147620 [Trifolium subterraneum]